MSESQMRPEQDITRLSVALDKARRLERELRIERQVSERYRVLSDERKALNDRLLTIVAGLEPAHVCTRHNLGEYDDKD